MTTNSGIDMHMHSRYSPDGEYAPRELVRMARKSGIRCIAVSDHNSVDGVAEAVAAGAEEHVAVIPCVELDCLYERGSESASLHVLGYCIDHKDARFEAVRRDVENRERAAESQRIELVRALGITVDSDTVAALAAGGVAICEMIAEAALADSRNDGNPLLLPFRPGGARSDNPYVNFYWDYCAPGKSAHVPVEYMPFADCLALIASAGGAAALAHPGQSLRGKEHLFAGIAGAGLSGIEAYSSYHSPEDRLRWKAEADRLGLVATCGSDFHGRMKPAIRMGGHGADGAAMNRCAEGLRRLA